MRNLAIAIGAVGVIALLAFSDWSCTPCVGDLCQCSAYGGDDPACERVGASPAGFTVNRPGDGMCWTADDGAGHAYWGTGIPPAAIRASGWREFRIGPCAPQLDAGMDAGMCDGCAP